jgi:large conductance mechanosensitive channel
LKVLKGFKDFIARGNVFDLAVALVLGLAFAALVTSLVEDLLTPIVAAIIGEPDFSALTFTINDSVFSYGSFINAAIAFVSVAAAVYFFVVLPMNALKARQAEGEEGDSPGLPRVPLRGSGRSHALRSLHGGAYPDRQISAGPGPRPGRPGVGHP